MASSSLRLLLKIPTLSFLILFSNDHLILTDKNPIMCTNDACLPNFYQPLQPIMHSRGACVLLFSIVVFQIKVHASKISDLVFIIPITSSPCGVAYPSLFLKHDMSYAMLTIPCVYTTVRSTTMFHLVLISQLLMSLFIDS